MRLVINEKYGGFSLSRKAAEKLRDEGYPLAVKEFADRQEWSGAYGEAMSCLARNSWLSEIPRDDPTLIRLVEEMGDEASGEHAKLKIVEIPDGVAWEIEEYDGYEHVAEQHRTWP